MIDDILVPLDGSQTAEAALGYVERLPSRRVRLLQVEPDSEGPLLARVVRSLENGLEPVLSLAKGRGLGSHPGCAAAAGRRRRAARLVAPFRG
jgi:hypothetical protein